MADIAAADQALIVTWLEATITDLSDLLQGQTTADVVAATAPVVLSEINLSVGKRYSADSGDLPDDLLDLVKLGTIATILTDACRTLPDRELPWVQAYIDRYTALLKGLRDGTMAFGDEAEAAPVGVSSASEPRRFTTHDDWAETFDRTDLDDLF